MKHPPPFFFLVGRDWLEPSRAARGKHYEHLEKSEKSSHTQDNQDLTGVSMETDYNSLLAYKLQ